MPEFKLEPLDESTVEFVYETRRHPEVCANLFGVPPADMVSHRAWLTANIPAKRLMYILRVDGVPVGYCHAYNFDGNTMEAGFVVHPDFQRRGYGHAMLRIFLEEMSKKFPCGKVYLHVKDTNHIALGLYESLGFIRMKAQDGIVIMGKDL
jgi:ribosomal protein S18 acetylase RimI-like enzyme